MVNIRIPGIIASLLTIGLTIPLLWLFAWSYNIFDCNGGLALLIIISILDLVLLTFASIGFYKKLKERRTIIGSVDIVKESDE
ncbi:MAG: hypothetical protein H7641_02710 [Candidatus Heimdallarchaeota archaeon]|nr:hypothetical protein [Candidatus Heimdallarchaeota archaeon]MCK4876475.1 hypothetical protein [Candidatus Heimdallarchaeota archaeon]